MDAQPPFGELFGTIWDALQSDVGKVKTMLPPAREHRNQALEGKQLKNNRVFATPRVWKPFVHKPIALFVTFSIFESTFRLHFALNFQWF